MIAKITRGTRPGDIGAYLHGPGKADEHEYTRGGRTYTGGEVIASNVGFVGDVDPSGWVPRLREAIGTRPEAARPVWQVSLRNTAEDPTLSNQTWADIAAEFAERMGLDEHPWVAVRHGGDHIHIVASRVRDDGQLWAGQHDRRAAQRACTALERAHGLQVAPRRKGGPKKSVLTLRDETRTRVVEVAKWRDIDTQLGRRISRDLSPAAVQSLLVSRHAFPEDTATAPNARHTRNLKAAAARRRTRQWDYQSRTASPGYDSDDNTRGHATASRAAHGPAPRCCASSDLR